MASVLLSVSTWLPRWVLGWHAPPGVSRCGGDRSLQLLVLRYYPELRADSFVLGPCLHGLIEAAVRIRQCYGTVLHYAVKGSPTAAPEYLSLEMFF